MSEVFAVENMVILTSKIEIDANQWICNMKQYYWEPIIRKNNTRFLILTGTHGQVDGKLGRKDYNMFLDYECAIKGLKEYFKDDINKYNIEIFLEDVGNYVEASKISEEKLVAAVKKYKPTVIGLAFCFTEKSEINDILRAAGIYSILIMSQDRAEITEGKYIFLDERQKEIIKRVSSENPQNVILWGSSGTGKTILLSQALGIKVSNLKRQSIPYKIIVSSFGTDKVQPRQLMKYMESKYLGHLKYENLQFGLFKDICKGTLIIFLRKTRKFTLPLL